MEGGLNGPSNGEVEMRSSLLILAAVVLTTAQAARGEEDQVYRWADRGGHLHFSNVPSPGSEATGIVSNEELPVTPPAPPGQPGATQGGSNPGSPDHEESPHAAVQRQDLERQIKDAERQLHALDARLGDLAAVRTRFAKGTPVGGGLPSNAGGVLSDEEKSLAQQRDSLKAGVERMRADMGKLQ